MARAPHPVRVSPHSASIRVRLVLALVLALLVLITIQTWREVIQSKHRTIEEGKRGAARMLAHVAPTIERFYATGDRAGAALLIARLGDLTDVSASALVEPSGSIAASGPASYRGRRLDVTPLRAALADLRLAVATGAVRVVVPPAGRTVIAITPVVTRRAGAGPDYLVLLFDLEPRLHAARLNVYSEGLGFAIASALALLLLWLFLDASVTRPAMRIARAADRLAEGDLASRTALAGDDEIQRAGRAFDRMADRFQAAEADAHGARVLLDTVLQSLPVGVIVFERQGMLMRYANPRWFKLLGLEPPLRGDFATLRGMVRLERMDGSLMPDDELTVPTVLRTGQPATQNMQIVHPNGSRVPVFVTSVPVALGGGESFDAVACVALDRRELERALSDLREWERRYEIVVASTGQVVFEWDVRADRVQRSGSIQAVLGYAPDELDTRLGAWSALIHPDDREAVLGELEACRLDSKRAYETTYRFLHKDGSWRVVRDRGFFERDRDGTALRMLGTMADVTERHRLEEQIRHAQRMETVGTLAGGVANDFNNQLTAVIGHLELLGVSLELDDARQEHVNVARDAAARCAELTRGLLAFSRRLSTRIRPTGLDEGIERVTSLLRRVLPDTIRLAVELPADTWPVLGDEEMIQQVMMNLCLNARDAMPRGGDLRVWTRNVTLAEAAARHPEARPGRFVEIGFSDTGRGMAPDVQARVYEPFYTTKPSGGGTGLGLSMAYGIVASHRGWIELESEPRKGTTFRVYLPAAENEPAARAAEPEPRGAE